VVSLEPGEDPDSFVRKFGKSEGSVSGGEAVEQKIQQAKSFIDFKYETLGKDFSQLSLREQETVIRDLADTAKKISDDIRRNLFVKKVAQIFKIDEVPIFKLLGKGVPSAVRRPPSAVSTKASEASLKGEDKIEKGILRLLLEDRRLLKTISGKLEPQDFSIPEHKEIFELIKAEKKTSPASLMDKTENEKTKELIAQIATIDLGPADPSVLLSDHLKTLNKLKTETRMKTLKEEIKKALQNGDNETADRLTKEFEKLKKS
jgi:DNA primase